MKRILGVILVLLLVVSFLTACCSLCDLPAEFRLTSIAILPSMVTVNDTVTIRATIANVGGSSGSGEVDLIIDGYTDSKSINIAGEESTGVSFSYLATTEGSYTVTITTPNDTKSKSFTVSAGGEDGEQ